MVLEFLLRLLIGLPLPIIILLIMVAVVTMLAYQNSLQEDFNKLPKLYFKRSALTKYLLKKCKILTAPFTPNTLAGNCHLQTILPHFLPGPETEFEREYLQMRDKGIVALDWSTRTPCRLTKLSRKAPVMLIIPGFIGSVDNFRSLCHIAVADGFRCVVFNRRGCGGCPLTTSKLQSFGDPSDFRQVVKYIHGKYPQAPLVSVGISSGSGLLLSYLGEYGSSTYLSAGVCISPGYDYQALYTRNGLSKYPYTWLILMSLKFIISKHATALSKIINVNLALRSNNLADFEENVFCKMYGYENMDQYWEKNNPMRDADEISIPVLAVNSLDDPLCSQQNIPFDLFKMYPNFLLAATQRGGHGGFLEGSTCERWGNKLAVEYLKNVLDFIEHDS